MARTTTVKAARKAQGTCGHCGKPIEVGDSYRWVAIKTGQRSSKRMVRCLDPKCSFRPSELTVSRRGEVYAVVEAAEDDLGAWTTDEGMEALAEIANTAAEGIREVAEGYREGASNIEDGFGHPTSQSEEMEGTADELDSFADEVESAGTSLEDAPTLVESDEDDENLDDEETDDERDARRQTDYEEALDAWGDESRDAIEDALGGCPV